MIDVPIEFQPIINVRYPAANAIEFERWFCHNYDGSCETFFQREYLPIFWTGYLVNNNYAKTKFDVPRLQAYVDSLDRSKKYFTIVQYDLGIVVDLNGLDLLEFNMSQTGKNKYPLPLIGQPNLFEFNEPKKYIANFVGNLTHPIREHAKTLQGLDGFYISFDRHSPEDYCRIIAQSYFTLCYRGFGINSFRIAEALQYGSIPVYISDEFIEPHNMRFSDYGLTIHESLLSSLIPILNDYRNENCDKVYKEYFTYEGTRDKILKYLENESTKQ